MKNSLIILSSLLFAGSLAAETTVTLSGVHNCCKGCTNGIVKAVATVKDATATAVGKTVTITAKSKADARKAVEALEAAGYYGTSDAAEKASASSGSAASKKLTEATVSSVHLCCQKCATAMADAVKSVPGVTEHTVASKASTFTVKGEFTEAELVAALNKAGFAGTVK